MLLVTFTSRSVRPMDLNLIEQWLGPRRIVCCWVSAVLCHAVITLHLSPTANDFRSTAVDAACKWPIAVCSLMSTGRCLSSIGVVSHMMCIQNFRQGKQHSHECHCLFAVGVTAKDQTCHSSQLTATPSVGTSVAYPCLGWPTRSKRVERAQCDRVWLALRRFHVQCRSSVICINWHLRNSEFVMGMPCPRRQKKCYTQLDDLRDSSLSAPICGKATQKA